MPVQDIRSDLKQTLAFLGIINSDTTTEGAILDTADWDLGVMFAVACTVYSAGTFNFVIEEGDDAALGDASDVTAAQLIGTLAALETTAATAEGATLLTVGVFSTKRYLRINVVSTSSGDATIIAVATKKGEDKPVI
jgi:hypothetical protein